MEQALELLPSEPAPRAAVVVNAADHVMGLVERIMTDPNIPLERVNHAFEFYKKVQEDAARKAFDAAMADAKSAIPPILKTRLVSHKTKDGGTKSYNHEDLAGIARVVDPILSKHGLSYRFRTTSNPNEPVSVTCIVSHRLGYFEENTLSGPRDDSGNKNSLQAMGSTITYLQRYTLKAALGLSAAHDDDAKASEQTIEDVITTSEFDDLVALAEEVGANRKSMCAFYKVETLADLPKSKLKEAIAFLNKRRG